ncbi:hypothetical protein [Coleofasciculus sp. FACHB-1120]|nr:hypothetical protein [Coleofasciculus sp. FACHB-1120]
MDSHPILKQLRKSRAIAITLAERWLRGGVEEVSPKYTIFR